MAGWRHGSPVRLLCAAQRGASHGLPQAAPLGRRRSWVASFPLGMGLMLVLRGGYMFPVLDDHMLAAPPQQRERAQAAGLGGLQPCHSGDDPG